MQSRYVAGIDCHTINVRKSTAGHDQLYYRIDFQTVVFLQDTAAFSLTTTPAVRHIAVAGSVVLNLHQARPVPPTSE